MAYPVHDYLWDLTTNESFTALKGTVSYTSEGAVFSGGGVSPDAAADWMEISAYTTPARVTGNYVCIAFEINIDTRPPGTIAGVLGTDVYTSGQFWVDSDGVGFASNVDDVNEPNLALSTWHNVIVKIRAHSTLNSYATWAINGSLLQAETQGGNANTLLGAKLQFGSVAGNYGFDGTIRNVRVWEQDLTDAQLQEISASSYVPPIDLSVAPTSGKTGDSIVISGSNFINTPTIPTPTDEVPLTSYDASKFSQYGDITYDSNGAIFNGTGSNSVSDAEAVELNWTNPAGNFAVAFDFIVNEYPESYGIISTSLAYNGFDECGLTIASAGHLEQGTGGYFLTNGFIITKGIRYRACIYYDKVNSNQLDVTVKINGNTSYGTRTNSNYFNLSKYNKTFFGCARAPSYDPTDLTRGFNGQISNVKTFEGTFTDEELIAMATLEGPWSNSITLNSQPVSAFSVDTDNQITATVPDLGTSNIDAAELAITNDSGYTYTSTTFDYKYPVALSVLPTSGQAGGSIVITGNQFAVENYVVADIEEPLTSVVPSGANTLGTPSFSSDGMFCSSTGAFPTADGDGFWWDSYTAPATDFTIAFDFKLRNIPTSSGKLFAIRGRNGILQIDNTGIIESTYTPTKFGSANDSNWHTAAVRLYESGGVYYQKISVDGSTVDLGNTSFISEILNSNNIVFGCYNSIDYPNTYGFDGWIKNIRVWEQTLTDAQLQGAASTQVQNTITLNAVDVTEYTVDSTTQITAVVPDLGTSNIDDVELAITNDSGSIYTSTTFDYKYPVALSVLPTSGKTGDSIVITGGQFKNTAIPDATNSFDLTSDEGFTEIGSPQYTVDGLYTTGNNSGIKLSNLTLKSYPPSFNDEFTVVFDFKFSSNGSNQYLLSFEYPTVTGAPAAYYNVSQAKWYIGPYQVTGLTENTWHRVAMRFQNQGSQTLVFARINGVDNASSGSSSSYTEIFGKNILQLGISSFSTESLNGYIKNFRYIDSTINNTQLTALSSLSNDPITNSITLNGEIVSTYTVDSITQITATVPDLGTSNIDAAELAITNDSGSIYTSTAFDYKYPASISVLPIEAYAGDTFTLTLSTDTATPPSYPVTPIALYRFNGSLDGTYNSYTASGGSGTYDTGIFGNAIDNNGTGITTNIPVRDVSIPSIDLIGPSGIGDLFVGAWVYIDTLTTGYIFDSGNVSGSYARMYYTASGDIYAQHGTSALILTDQIPKVTAGNWYYFFYNYYNGFWDAGYVEVDNTLRSRTGLSHNGIVPSANNVVLGSGIDGRIDQLAILRYHFSNSADIQALANITSDITDISVNSTSASYTKIDGLNYQVTMPNLGSSALTATVEATGTDYVYTSTTIDYLTNVAPTDISISSNNVPENESIGTEVGTFTTTDANVGDTHTYTLVAGTGDDDNASFTISTASLLTAEVFNKETKDTYSIRVRTTDQDSEFFEKAFTISITNVNEVPTNISLSPASVNENQPIGTTVGTLTSTDPDVVHSNYVAFDGIDQYAAYENDVLMLADQGAISLWFKRDRINTTEVLFSARTYGRDVDDFVRLNDFVLNINSSNKVNIVGGGSSAESTPTNITADTTLIDNTTEWYHLVLTKSSLDVWNMYINGIQQTFTSPSFGTKFILDDTMATYTLYSTIGAYRSESVPFTSCFAGSIDEFSIWNDDLSALEVSEIYNSGTPTDLSQHSSANKLFNWIQITGSDEFPTLSDHASDNDVTLSDSMDSSDIVKSFTYSLVVGTGSDDNASFSISGDSLLSGEAFDYETKSSYAIRIRSTDSGGLYFEKQFTISINNVNETPTDITLSNTSVAENQPIPTLVGTIGTTDEDVGDTFIYSLTVGYGDNSSFLIVGDELFTNAIFDYETKNTYSIQIESEDSGANVFTKQFTINVTDVNETPTAITLSNDTFKDNVANGYVIGTFTTTDVDAGDTFTYTLQDDAGGRFAVVGDELQVLDNSLLDYHVTPTHDITVRSTDAGGLYIESTITIQLISAKIGASFEFLDGNIIPARGPYWYRVKITDDNPISVDNVSVSKPVGYKTIFEQVSETEIIVKIYVTETGTATITVTDSDGNISEV